uniref:DnaJ protein n=1 Tax=Parastrongyloides trichosuri TaxID=131310 RepID=A0A0N4ZG87_PARTI
MLFNSRHIIKLYSLASVSLNYTPIVASLSCNNKNNFSNNSCHIRNYHSTKKLLKDYYDILGVDKKANAKEIKKAYYKLAKKYHPDVNKDKDAPQKFQELTQAYEILSDENKRAQYDSTGKNPFAGTSGHSSADYDWNDASMHARKIFESMFGNSANFDRWNNGFGETVSGFDRTTEAVMNITFEEAVKGATKEININVVDDCIRCRGSGCEPPHKKVECPYCNGSGMKTFKQGSFLFSSSCGYCKGTGNYNKNPCMDCEGHGKLVQNRSSKINIPAGIDNGESIKCRIGKQDVYITFRVSPSKIHKRDRYDIYTDVAISLSQAALGGTVVVPGLKEDITINIPKGCSSHSRFALKEHGIKRVNEHGSGDQYIDIKIVIPKNLTKKQQEALLMFAEDEKNLNGTISGLDEWIKNKKKNTNNKEDIKEKVKEKEKQSTKIHEVNNENSNPKNENEDGFFDKLKKSIF